MLAAFSPYIMTSSQNFFPCVTFGQFSLFLISPLGVVTLENKKKTSGFLLHSLVIRFISNPAALVTMVANVCLTCRITGINQYQSSWFTVRPSLIYGFLHFTDVQRPVIFFFQIIRDLNRKISFSTAIISWVITLMNSNLHESLIDIRPSSILSLIFSSVKFYLSNNVALRHKE